MLPIFVKFHAHLDLSTETCIMFLLEADNIRDWNQKEHAPSVASASTTRLQYKRHTYWILNRNQSKLNVFSFFFFFGGPLSEMKWPIAQLGKRVREMQKASVSGSGLSLLEGICYLSRDKGNCGVSVYGAALIASPLKDPTYGTLIDSWQHTQGGFWSVFVGTPQQVSMQASVYCLPLDLCHWVNRNYHTCVSPVWKVRAMHYLKSQLMSVETKEW